MRIVTRPDFDGVVCAVLISDALDIQRPVRWLEPNEFQKGLADIRAGDIVANLPFHPDCELWFDHHATNTADRPFRGLFRKAPSAASLVLEYFKPRLERDYTELVHWADRVDSADFTQGMVLQPEKFDYVLLSMTVSGEDSDGVSYWNRLVRLLREKSMRDVMADPEVAKHCRTVVEQNARYADVIEAHTRIEKHVSITDLRGLDHPPSGNRFLVYCMFPETVVNVRIRYENTKKDTVVVNIGHSIFNPHCNVHVGKLLAGCEGGGHRGAASTRFDVARAARYLRHIIDTLLKNESGTEAVG
ncbi:MAG: exopolyphosphatase [Deltaproteobacteria bacterium]|nr:exopolyphosphatase [Deltaproteobacteria bacterium]